MINSFSFAARLDRLLLKPPDSLFVMCSFHLPFCPLSSPKASPLGLSNVSMTSRNSEFLPVRFLTPFPRLGLCRQPSKGDSVKCNESY